jgi:hypothetical protein
MLRAAFDKKGGTHAPHRQVEASRVRRPLAGERRLLNGEEFKHRDGSVRSSTYGSVIDVGRAG